MATKRGRHHRQLGCKILTCFVILVFDIAAGVLCIQADAAQSKVGHLKLWLLECRNPSHEAFKLGLAAAVLVFVAHPLSNSRRGCVLSKEEEEAEQPHKSSSCNTQLKLLSLVIQWVVLTMIFIFLIIGTWGEWGSRKICGMVPRQRYLTMGGIMCFVHAPFSLTYYLTANATATPEEEEEEEEEEEKNDKAAQQVITNV